MRSYVSHLESTLDGSRFEFGKVWTTHKERPLWVAYDLKKLRRSYPRKELLRLARQGRSLAIEEILERHFETVERDLKRLNDFAVVCLRQQRPDWAERALRLVLESDPSNPGVLSNLAAAIRMQGRGRSPTLSRASRARCTSPTSVGSCTATSNPLT